MIQRAPRTDEERRRLEQEGFDDPFDVEEEDPMETDAIESSLWEIVALQTHFHPNVATLANIISEQFTKVSYNLEDFLDHSYGSVSRKGHIFNSTILMRFQMIEAELVKDVKKAPAIEYEIPKKIYTGGEVHLRSRIFDFS